MAEKKVKLKFDLSPDGEYKPEMLECVVTEDGNGEQLCENAEHGRFVKFPKGSLANHVKAHNKANS